MNIENGQSAQVLQTVSECSTAVMLLLATNTEKYNVCISIENIIYYRPLTKLRVGNVFSCISPSFCLWEGGSHVTHNHDALDLTVLGPSPTPPNMKPHWTGTPLSPAPLDMGPHWTRTPGPLPC